MFKVFLSLFAAATKPQFLDHNGHIFQLTSHFFLSGFAVCGLYILLLCVMLCSAFFKAALISIFYISHGSNDYVSSVIVTHRELPPKSVALFSFIDPFSIFQRMVLVCWLESFGSVSLLLLALFPAVAGSDFQEKHQMTDT